MPSERQMWDRLRPLLIKQKFDPVRMENSAMPGTPDVNYIEGWIELKYIPRWPVRWSSLKISHYTSEQRAWLMRRWNQGGRCFMLLRVDHDWMLFDGWTAQMVGELNRVQLLELCLWHTTNPKLDIESLSRWLKADRKVLKSHEWCQWMRVQCQMSVKQVALKGGWLEPYVYAMEKGLKDCTPLMGFWES